MSDLNAPGLTINCEVYDSEIIQIEAALVLLNEQIQGGQRVNRGEFDRQIVERFQDLGFVAVVNWYTAATSDGALIPDMLIPEIVIRDRIERHEFDHDKMVHEVTHDILETGDGGVIKADMSAFQEPDHKH